MGEGGSSAVDGARVLLGVSVGKSVAVVAVGWRVGGSSAVVGESVMGGSLVGTAVPLPSDEGTLVGGLVSGSMGAVVVGDAVGTNACVGTAVTVESVGRPVVGRLVVGMLVGTAVVIVVVGAGEDP